VSEVCHQGTEYENSTLANRLSQIDDDMLNEANSNQSKIRLQKNLPSSG
jgi:hypothetical protein